LKLLLALQDPHHRRWTIYSVAVFVWRAVGSCDIKAYKKCMTFAQLNSGLKQNENASKIFYPRLNVKTVP
jgi:hypothetical protein